MKNKVEKRAFTEYRAEENDKGQSMVTGTPIVFEQPTDICGWYQETIARGAIDNSVLTDVDFYYNHDLNTKPHARTRNGKLNLTVENDGVRMVAELNRDRIDSNDLYLAIQDGVIDGMSFMFRVGEDEWTDLDTDYPKRRILKIAEVIEVSAVNYPAYEGTSINARNNVLDDEKKVVDEARSKIKDNSNNELELLKIKSKL